MFLLGFLGPTYRSWNVPAILNGTKNFIQKAVKLSKLFFPFWFWITFYSLRDDIERKKKNTKNTSEMASSSSVTNWAFCLSNYTCADPVGHWLAFPILRVVQITSRWISDRVSWHYSAVSRPCLYSRTTSFWCLQVFSASGTLTSQIVRKSKWIPCSTQSSSFFAKHRVEDKKTSISSTCTDLPYITLPPAVIPLYSWKPLSSGSRSKLIWLNPFANAPWASSPKPLNPCLLF